MLSSKYLHSKFKKTVLVLYALLLSLATFIYAETGIEDKLVENQKIKQKNDPAGTHTVYMQIASNINQGVEKNIFYASLFYQYKNKYLKTLAALQMTSAHTGYLAHFQYIPIHSKEHSLKLGLQFHVNSMYRVATEFDIIPEIEYVYTIPDTFIFSTQLGYMNKLTLIHIKNEKPVAIDHSSMTAAFSLSGIIKKEWYLGFELSSYEIFRYPLFFHPTFSLNLKYLSTGKNLPKGLFFKFSTGLRYSDFFTPTGYPQDFIFKLGWGLEIYEQ